MVDVNTNDTYSIKYNIKFSRKNTMAVTEDSLKPRDVPDIGSIQISPEDYKNE